MKLIVSAIMVGHSLGFDVGGRIMSPVCLDIHRRVELARQVGRGFDNEVLVVGGDGAGQQGVGFLVIADDAVGGAEMDLLDDGFRQIFSRSRRKTLDFTKTATVFTSEVSNGA